MTTRFLIAASLLALAACGSKGDGNSTKASGGGLLGGSVQLQPGEWEMTMQVVDYKAPNMPASVAQQMKAAPPTTTRDCMTEEEAKGPKPESFAPAQSGMTCKHDEFAWGNGRIHGKTNCDGANGATKVAMTMDGNYTPTSMDMNIKTQTETNNVAASVDMKISGRRIGECPAGKAG